MKKKSLGIRLQPTPYLDDYSNYQTKIPIFKYIIIF